MKHYEINITFENLEECEKWENENIPNRTYDGRPVLMVSHEQKANEKKITLLTITTF